MIKDPKKAGILGLVLGPFGMMYASLPIGVAAVAVYIWLISLPDPDWLYLLGFNLVWGFVAYHKVALRNAVEEAQRPKHGTRPLDTGTQDEFL